MVQVTYSPRILTSGTAVVGDHDTYGELGYAYTIVYESKVAVGKLAKDGIFIHGVTVYETTGSGITGSGSHPDPIPEGSIITDAFLRLTPSETSNAINMSLDVFIPGLDDRWSRLPMENLEGPEWINHAASSFDLRVTVDGPAKVTDTLGLGGNLGGNAYGKLRTVSGSGPEGLGQLFQTTAAGTLNTVRLYLRRDGGLSLGNVWVEVYFPTDSGGGSFVFPSVDADFPDLDAGIVATSLTAPTSNLSANFGGAYADFSFTGDNKIQFKTGDRYVAVLRGDYPYDEAANVVWFYRGACVNFFGTYLCTGTYWTTGSSSSGSGLRRTSGFNDHQYIGRIELPARTNDAGNSINTPAFGTSLTFTVPQWTAGVVVEIGSIADLIQEWVGNAFFDSSLRYLGIPIMLSSNVSSGGVDRRYESRHQADDSIQAELVVTYRAPEDRRVQVVD